MNPTTPNRLTILISTQLRTVTLALLILSASVLMTTLILPSQAQAQPVAKSDLSAYSKIECTTQDGKVVCEIVPTTILDKLEGRAAEVARTQAKLDREKKSHDRTLDKLEENTTKLNKCDGERSVLSRQLSMRKDEADAARADLVQEKKWGSRWIWAGVGILIGAGAAATGFTLLR